MHYLNMALIDKASLLMVPSTYEAGTLYNVLPSGNRAPDSTDQNSGYDQTRADFTFDRGTDHGATRIGSDGLIKKYRENLLLQSNQFDTTWVNANSSETSGQADKDGGTDAWKIDLTGVSGRIYQSKSQSGVVTFSVYAKKGTLDWVVLSSNIVDASFNLSTGEKGTLVAGITSSIEDVGGGWYRCSCTGSGAFTQFRVYPAIADNTFTGTSGNIYIQNAQAESSMVATDYLDSGATTAKAGVLIDLPRINYDANGENGSLLLEPSRQQLVQYSEYLAVGWTYNNTSVISNSIVSPTGEISASKLLDNTTNGLHRMYYITGTSASAHTFSIFLKKGEYSKVEIESLSGVTTNITYDLLNGTATSVGEIEPYGNDWYRCIFPMSTTSPSNAIQIRLVNNSNASVFVGTGTSGVHMFGAQLEAGSYATSYIPNMGESGGVTRAADSCLDGGSAESINSTEGVLYAEILALAEDVSFKTICLHDGTNTQRINIWYWNDGTFKVDGHNNNVQQFNFDFAADLTALNKIAVKYKANDFSVFLNGSKINSDTSGATPIGLNTLDFRNGNNLYPFYGNVKQVAVFNEALSDSELATLTTL